MADSYYHIRFALVRSPALAAALYRADMLACAILCGVVHTICWAIAVVGFIGWLLYRLLCGLIWLLEGGIMICIYTGSIVWIILVWAGQRFVRVIILVLRGLRRLGWVLRHVVAVLMRWAIREFGEPTVCAACVYFGVLSTSVLPIAVMLQFAPVALAGMVLSPVAAFAIAARVFDTRAYGRWQRGARARLGARVLRAYSDGVTWAAWLRMPRAEMRQMA